MIFIGITLAQLTVGRVWHSIDLGQLLRFPLNSWDYFTVILIDATLNEFIIYIFVLGGPMLAALVLNPSGMLVMLPVLLLYALFLVAWMHLLSGMRSYLMTLGFTSVLAQLGWLTALACIALFFLMPGLVQGSQGVFLDAGYWQQRLVAGKAVLESWKPFINNIPPGLTANSFFATLGSHPAGIWRNMLMLALETAFMLALMYEISRAVHLGRITLGTKQSKRQLEWLRRSFASRPPFGAGVLLRFAGFDFWQLVRKEWLYARRFNTMNVQIALTPIGWLLALLFHATGVDAFVPGIEKWTLIFAAALSCWMGTEVFSQKFNWEGTAVVTLFLTPLPRRTMLAAKSFAVVMPVALVNALGLALCWAFIDTPPAFALGAAVLLACGLAISDAHGSIISMLAPVNLQAFHNIRKRRNIDQRGCITEFLLHFATFILLLTLLPLFAMLAPGLFSGSFLLELAGAAVCILVTWYYTRWVRADAAKLLMQREPAIWRLLKDPF
jgi:hypothetical protein